MGLWVSWEGGPRPPQSSGKACLSCSAEWGCKKQGGGPGEDLGGGRFQGGGQEVQGVCRGNTLGAFQEQQGRCGRSLVRSDCIWDTFGRRRRKFADGLGVGYVT